MITGRPTSLTILNFGQFMVHDGPRIIQLMGAVIRTDQDEVILVDTGMPEKYAVDARAAGIEDGLDSFGEVVQLGPENTLRGQLAKAGVTKLDLVILTHGHIDHVGCLDLLRGVPILVGKPERDMDRPSYFGDCQPIAWPQTTYFKVKADLALSPGLDVFFVPGHAPGQLALGITLPHLGRVIWTSDAISRETEMEEGFPGAWDSDQAQVHAQRLLDMPNDLLIYGHDPDQRLRLRYAPFAIT